jgi:hypothetical protein
MRQFGRCHHRLIEIPIHNDDNVVRAGATIILSAGVVRAAPFVEAVRTTICQGNTHQRYPPVKPRWKKKLETILHAQYKFFEHKKENSQILFYPIKDS